MGGLRSIETIVVPSREAASDPFVLQRLRGAEEVFIAGGDQGDHLQFWKGTPLADTLQELADRNVPIGGTSAGLAVLGQFIYAGLHQSASSAAALADPYDKDLTLDRDFLALPTLTRVITDSHLHARDRMGAPQTPLTYQNVGVQRLSGAGTFDLNNWAGYGATANYSLSAVKGRLTSTQAGGAVY